MKLTTPPRLGKRTRLDLQTGKGHFSGRDASRSKNKAASGAKLVGFEMLDTLIARDGYPVFYRRPRSGRVTSGSPRAVPEEKYRHGLRPCERAPWHGNRIGIRGHAAPARIVAMPFYKRPVPSISRVHIRARQRIRERNQSMYPSDYRYTKEHEWVHFEGDFGTVGITDYAQQELGDVVFVDMPKVGAKLAAGASLAASNR